MNVLAVHVVLLFVLVLVGIFSGRFASGVVRRRLRSGMGQCGLAVVMRTALRRLDLLLASCERRCCSWLMLRVVDGSSCGGNARVSRRCRGRGFSMLVDRERRGAGV